jgi:hypothetical protein
MPLNKELIIQELQLIPYGGMGWMRGKDLACLNPSCGKRDKFGINLSEYGGGVHCFYCDYSESIFVYLNKIGKKDLAHIGYNVCLDKKLKGFDDEVEEEKESVKIELPKGFKRIISSKYLSERGFTPEQVKKFEVGITDHFLEKKLHNYLVFQIKQKGQMVGWLARSKYSKEWHKQNLDNFKAGKEKLALRYRNSEGVDFVKLLGNYDDLTPNTHTVILVEGLFDAENVINQLGLNGGEELKCCFTFGNKISNEQISLLRKLPGIKNIILMYDFNTIQQIKKYGMSLQRYFNVDVAEIGSEDIDPGDASENYLLEILKNKKNILYFYTSRITNNL